MTGFPRVSSPHTPRFPAPRPPFWRRGGCGRGPRRRGGVAWPGAPRARFLRGGRPGPGPCAHSFGMDFAAAASSHSQRPARARRPPPRPPAPRPCVTPGAPARAWTCCPSPARVPSSSWRLPAGACPQTHTRSCLGLRHASPPAGPWRGSCVAGPRHLLFHLCVHRFQLGCCVDLCSPGV